MYYIEKQEEEEKEEKEEGEEGEEEEEEEEEEKEEEEEGDEGGRRGIYCKYAFKYYIHLMIHVCKNPLVRRNTFSCIYKTCYSTIL